ncbi:hypothetical protein AB0H83_30990 [Dactylosporangium sp. NPDC050688]|uniref:ComF family protein n=1 Tax=Dactylosporangium sp. NPDC050688 TaxID=3157217 RepID=UPI00340468B4
MLADLLDLVLPATCAGCDEPARGPLCEPCRVALAAAKPGRTRPVPEPPGLPPVYALAAYAGSVRRMLIQYKERNRHELTPALGGLLARVVLTAVTAPGGTAAPGSSGAFQAAAGFGGAVTLVPVPATAAAARRRFGDHIDRIAQEAAAALRRRGVDARVVGLLRALPKREDSAELSAAERARAAGAAFTVRGRRLAPGNTAAPGRPASGVTGASGRAASGDLSTGRPAPGVASLSAAGAPGAPGMPGGGSLSSRAAAGAHGRGAGGSGLRGTVVLVDDIITTGSTLAASAARLAAAGIRVDRVAVLAATQRAT